MTIMDLMLTEIFWFAKLDLDFLSGKGGENITLKVIVP